MTLPDSLPVALPDAFPRTRPRLSQFAARLAAVLDALTASGPGRPAAEDEREAFLHDPLAHPLIAAMDQRQLADLPFPAFAGRR